MPTILSFQKFFSQLLSENSSLKNKIKAIYTNLPEQLLFPCVVVNNLNIHPWGKGGNRIIKMQLEVMNNEESSRNILVITNIIEALVMKKQLKGEDFIVAKTELDNSLRFDQKRRIWLQQLDLKFWLEVI